VSGRLEYSEWATKTANSRSRHEVIADEVEFLDPADAPATEAELGPRTSRRSTARRAKGTY
jgi:single-stranded DNA-binding protein